MQKIKNFIDGKFVEPVADDWLENFCPADGERVGQIANSGSADVQTAVEAARAALPGWIGMAVEARSHLLLKLAELIEQNLTELAEAESEDSGKPLVVAKSIDIPRAAANFRFFAHAITQFASEAHENSGQNAINFTLRHPIGVVGCISPWNLPLYLFTWKIAPALAAGNCVVAKPSELTPRTASMLGELCNQAGIPAGVLNILHGEGATVGQAIVEHPNVKAISFTGGTATGSRIAATAAPKFKKLSLELGGKNPNIIFADCDYEKMLATTIRSSFYNQGQLCLCGSRIFVESSIYEKFKTDFIARTKELIVGHPSQESTNVGALISSSHLQKIASFMDILCEENATLLTGGSVAEVAGYPNGYYFQPTVIEVASNQCRLNQEEIFGPVVTLMPFESESDAIQYANDVRYGLSATIWSQDISRTMRVSKELESGIVWINCWLHRDLRTPFGGVKDSGVGREGGWEALRFFTEAKNVCIQY